MARKAEKVRGRHLLLLDESATVRRWYEKHRRLSGPTADTYLRRFGVFLEWARSREGWETASPALLEERARTEEGRQAILDLLQDFVTSEEAKEGGRGKQYIESSLKAVKSFLRRWYEVPRGEVTVAGTARSVKRPPPTREELAQVLVHASPREKVLIECMAHAGRRLEDMGDYRGTEGLRLRDFPELRIDGKPLKSPVKARKGGREVSFSKVPTLLLVRPELAGHECISFLGTEGCRDLASYLQGRIASGETLTPDSSLVHPVHKDAKKQFLYTLKLGDMIRRVYQAAGFTDPEEKRPARWRPNDLRHYFADATREAERKAKVPREYTRYWMGHKLADMKGWYESSGFLREEVREEMRTAYKRAEPFLSVGAPPSPGGNETIRALLVFLGVPREKAAGLDLDSLTPEQIAELAKAVPPKAPEKPGQKAVPLEDVPSLLEKGWEYVAPLNGSMAVLRAPPDDHRRPSIVHDNV